MKNYSADLYKKFTSSTVNVLQDDEFCEYFNSVMESGIRHYGQKNETLVKIIDEKWVNAIEACIIPLETIIKRPRRFIRRDENVVPIELARKVGPDAVKHLATHTHFISRINSRNEVIPSKILNVTSEESFEIYENRFIITLINRVYDFLNKRYKAIFNATGEEFASLLKVDSVFNDNDEKVEYDFTMKIYQSENFLDNKNNDRSIYERIEFFKMMIDGFRKSEFYTTLATCNPVRSPISKTNLIAKEPNFKKCYELWQFLESYNEVGYVFDRRNYNTDFSQDYVEQLNVMVLFNYLIMKNNLDVERNTPATVSIKRKKTLKPRFIKQLIEEFVFDYDIPEVELRKIFADEIQRNYNKKYENEAEILEILKIALGEEIEKKDQEFFEKEILEALKYALNLDYLQKEEEKVQNREKKIQDEEKAKLQRELDKQKEKERKLAEIERAKALAEKEREKKRRIKEREQLRIVKEREQKRLKKEKEIAKLAAQKEKAKITRELERIKLQEKVLIEKEKLRIQKEKEAAARQLKKQKELEKIRVEKEKAAEKLKADKLKEQEKIAKLKEKERLAKQIEKEKLAAIRAKEKEKEKAAAAKVKASLKAADTTKAKKPEKIVNDNDSDITE